VLAAVESTLDGLASDLARRLPCVAITSFPESYPAMQSAITSAAASINNALAVRRIIIPPQSLMHLKLAAAGLFVKPTQSDERDPAIMSTRPAVRPLLGLRSSGKRQSTRLRISSAVKVITA
jgi:hypothetical protein